MVLLGEIFPDFTADTQIGTIKFHEWLGNSIQLSILSNNAIMAMENLSSPSMSFYPNFAGRFIYYNILLTQGERHRVILKILHCIISEYLEMRVFKHCEGDMKRDGKFILNIVRMLCNGLNCSLLLQRKLSIFAMRRMRWGILFSHPNDFTPVCTTELARVVKLMPEFKRLGVKVIALSCNSVDSHRKWIEDIKSYSDTMEEEFPYPIIEDQTRKLATSLGMLDPMEMDIQTGLPMSARAVFIIDPAKKMRLSILYPATTGRNFDEIIRVVESLQLTEKYKIATPVDWKKGDDVMIDPNVSDNEAKASYNNIKTVILPSGRTYLRIVPQPIDA